MIDKVVMLLEESVKLEKVGPVEILEESGNNMLEGVNWLLPALKVVLLLESKGCILDELCVTSKIILVNVCVSVRHKSRYLPGAACKTVDDSTDIGIIVDDVVVVVAVASMAELINIVRVSVSDDLE